MPKRLCLFAALPAAVVLLCTAVNVLAQSAVASRPDPLDASASVPVTTYQSSFAGYRAQSEAAVAPWRDSNDTAARIGGWRAYAREAATDVPSPGSVAPSPAKPAPAEIKKPMPDGHHMHGGGKHAH